MVILMTVCYTWGRKANNAAAAAAATRLAEPCPLNTLLHRMSIWIKIIPNT